MNNNDLLAALAAYVVADGGDQEQAKARVKQILAGRNDSPVQKPKTIETAIKEHLRNMGVPTSIKGHSRLVCAIGIVAEDPTAAGFITKRLYPEVAKRLDDTPSRVERAIRHAVELAFDRGDLNVLKRYFGNTVSRSKGQPTNSEFITQIADVIRQELGM